MPASDDHPTHQKLPGFDSLKGIQKNEAYQFTFKRTGKYTYHDHLRPEIKGTVEVLSAELLPVA